MTNPFKLTANYRGALMGFAILWIILFHSGLKTDIIFFDEFIKIGYGGVDIFLYLSGLGLYYSLSKIPPPNNLNDFIYSKRIKQQIKSFYKRRLIRILPAFWLTLLIMFLFEYDYSLKSLAGLIAQCTTVGLWIPRIPYKLWYVSAILLFYLLIPYYYFIYQRNPHRTFAVALCVIIIILFFYSLFHYNVIYRPLYLLAIARLPIFLIGITAGHLSKISFIKSNYYFWIVTCLLGFIFLFLCRYYFPDYLWNCFLNFIPFIFIVPGLCIFMSYLFQALPKWIARPFTSLGLYTLEIYLINEFLLNVAITPLSSLMSKNTAILLILCLNIVLGVFLSKIVKLLISIR